MGTEHVISELLWMCFANFYSWSAPLLKISSPVILRADCPSGNSAEKDQVDTKMNRRRQCSLIEKEAHQAEYVGRSVVGRLRKITLPQSMLVRLYLEQGRLVGGQSQRWYICSAWQWCQVIQPGAAARDCIQVCHKEKAFAISATLEQVA